VGVPANLVVRDQDHVSVLALAAPVTVTPQFADWPISRRAAEWCESATERLLPGDEGAFVAPETEIEPAPRGVVVTRVAQHPRVRDQRDEVRLVADSGGVVAGRFGRGKSGREVLDLDRLRAGTLEPLVGALAQALQDAEAYGRSAWHVFVLLPHEIEIDGQRHGPQRISHRGGELTVPADDQDVAALARRVAREYARAAGLEVWEGEGR
jgi:hypothetical protein